MFDFITPPSPPTTHEKSPPRKQAPRRKAISPQRRRSGSLGPHSPPVGSAEAAAFLLGTPSVGTRPSFEAPPVARPKPAPKEPKRPSVTAKWSDSSESPFDTTPAPQRKPGRLEPERPPPSPTAGRPPMPPLPLPGFESGPSPQEIRKAPKGPPPPPSKLTVEPRLPAKAPAHPKQQPLPHPGGGMPRAPPPPPASLAPMPSEKEMPAVPRDLSARSPKRGEARPSPRRMEEYEPERRAPTPGRKEDVRLSPTIPPPPEAPLSPRGGTAAPPERTLRTARPIAVGIRGPAETTRLAGGIRQVLPTEVVDYCLRPDMEDVSAYMITDRSSESIRNATGRLDWMTIFESSSSPPRD